MRKLFAICLLGLSLFSALAHAVPDWIIPSPITLALQIGKAFWTKDSDDEVYYIRVQSRGLTETQARNEAFKLAVDKAVGSLLVSETKIHNGNLNSHEIINYSSGYIHDFEYVNIHRGQEIVLQVDVWVKKSKIAERISLSNQSQGELQGGRIAESFRSLHHEKRTGDRLIDTILDDYPEKSYDVNITKIEYGYENRLPILTIDFTVTWKNKFVSSFEEILQNIGEEKSYYDSNFSVRVDRANCVFCKEPKFLIDKHQSNHIFRRFLDPWTMVNLQFLATDGGVVHAECVYFPSLHGQVYNNSLWEANGVSVNIYADKRIKNTIKYDLSNIEINKLDTVNISVVRRNFCIN